MSVVWKNFDVRAYKVSVSRSVQSSVLRAAGCKPPECVQVALDVISPHFLPTLWIVLNNL
jgi:hypothetical protein